jgi:Max protein
MNDASNDLNGSTSSNSSISNNNGVDDLDIDSGDDEIDVGTHADSIGFNSSKSNGGGASSNNQDHNFGASSNGGSGGGGERSGGGAGAGGNLSELTFKADRKRAHHNALERKRRDHIKDSFHTLRDAIPNIKGEKVSTSRAQILKAATDYIKIMRTRNIEYQMDIDLIKKTNNDIENQIRQLEKTKQTLNPNSKQVSYIKNEPLIKSEPNIQSLDLGEDNIAMYGAGGSGCASSASLTNPTDLQQNDNSNTYSLNLNSLSNTNNNNNNSNVCFISKPITTTLINTTGGANAKKFKTIINPKSSLNIINISNSSNSNNMNTTVLTKAPTSITLNSNNINNNNNSNFAQSNDDSDFF